MFKSNLAKYEAFFGRQADLILPPSEKVTNSCFVYRFPPRKVGFLKRLFTPLNDVFVYITDGMSAIEMTIPEELKDAYPSRVEVLACSKSPIVGNVNGNDIIADILHWMVPEVIERDTFLGPAHAIDFGEVISQNSEMTGFFIGVPDGIEMSRLCRCTYAAQLIVSILPITPDELKLIETQGADSLLDEFERGNVPNLFDPFRFGVKK